MHPAVLQNASEIGSRSIPRLEEAKYIFQNCCVLCGKTQYEIGGRRSSMISRQGHITKKC